MSEEQEADNEETLEDSGTEESSEENEEQGYKHTCGAHLEEGMEYCPACGDSVDTSAY